MARSVTAVKGGSSRNRGILMLAVIFGLLSAVLMFAFLRSQGGDGQGTDGLFEDSQAARTVVVAAVDIAPGTVITSDMLTTKTLPGSALQVGVYEEPEVLEGKIATTAIVAGDQMVPARVTTFEGENSLAFKIPDGLRGLGLMVPHEGWIVGGLVQPGDRVDVVAITTLVVVDPLTGQEKVDFVTGIIAQNVEVLAASQTSVRRVPNLDEDSADSGGGALDGTGSTTTTATGVVEDAGSFETSISVTLALNPEEASKVALIDAMRDEDGQYRIILRQKGDGTPVAGEQTWSLDDIFIRSSN